MNAMQEKTIPQDGYALHYYTQGDPGRPMVIFIHPAFGDHTCFHHQMDEFAADYHVVAVDMLGHGRSQVNGAPVTIEKTADLIAQLITQEGHQQAHLVGVSLGSLLAQYTADRFPEQVRSVTVTGGYSIFGDNSQIDKTQRFEMVRWLFLVLFSMERFRRYVVSKTNVVDAERELFYQSTRHFTRRSFQVMPGMSKVLDRTPRHIAQPLFILVGEHDQPVVVEHAHIWHARAAGSRLAVIPAAGHCANMDNPQQFNRILREFLAQHKD